MVFGEDTSLAARGGDGGQRFPPEPGEPGGSGGDGLDGGDGSLGTDSIADESGGAPGGGGLANLDQGGDPGSGGFGALGEPNLSGFTARGGNGGSGGRGGAGQTGGNGGQAGHTGAGAGGTIKLVGSVLDASGATADVRGGAVLLGQVAADNGRIVTGSNTVGGGPGVTGQATQVVDVGMRTLNPYLLGGTETPYIAGLLGGAEAFGLLDLTAADFDEVRASAPTGAIVALLRLDIGPAGYADDYVGFDLLLMINLVDATLTAPSLGIDADGLDETFLQPLGIGGFALDPRFGGSGGFMALTTLDPFAVWGTLIPENGGIVNASVDGASPISGVSLVNGEYVFLTGPQVQPHCGDGHLDVGEECDDGNNFAGDGCSATCALDGNYDGDTDVDANDLTMLMGYRNMPASDCPTCDLDGDGIITSLDGRILVLMCTRPYCATE